ncbi:MAG: YceH family protein [Ignavibacteriales bacterium]|nr:YceH family protein [Ignavibacteriales bacterium]
MNLLLTEKEVRVIGSLIEKEITTPEYYPLSLNSLTNACNQKSNREPVVSYTEEDVEVTIELLRGKRFVRMVESAGRVPKFKQSFVEELKLGPKEIASLTVLMLRGPQTAGEIRSRSGRLFNFQSLNEIDETLENLNRREDGPFVIKLERQVGMKERRYSHLFCGQPVLVEKIEITNEEDRTAKLESVVEMLQNEVNQLKDQFAEFRKQFE